MLETSIDVLFAQPEPCNLTPSLEDDLDLPEAIEEDHGIEKDGHAQGERSTAASSGHGKTVDGKRVSCMIIHGSQLVNCAKCLLDAQRSLLAQAPTKRQKENTRTLLARLEKAGKMGLHAEDVWVSIALSTPLWEIEYPVSILTRLFYRNLPYFPPRHTPSLLLYLHWRSGRATRDPVSSPQNSLEITLYGCQEKTA
jgi:hypothetical protein